MQCPRCGEVVSAQDVVCPYCHYELDPIDARETGQTPQTFGRGTAIWPTDPHQTSIGVQTPLATARSSATNGYLLAVALIAAGVLGLLLFIATAGAAFNNTPSATANTLVATHPTATLQPTLAPTFTAVPTDTPLPSPSPTPISQEIAINSGGNANGIFSGDMDFSGGSLFTSNATIDTSAVKDPAPQSVYQSERYGAFTYTIGGLQANAPYKVRLHFVELVFTSKGQRIFNVMINNHPVLNNFDIFEQAGGINRALIREFTATADRNGQIIIAYIPTDKNNPKSSGIEIIPVTG